MNRTVPVILAVALFMEQMDSTVISTALPAIAADLGTDPIALKLALTAYLVALAIFVPVSGWMADRIGAKSVFRAAIGVFVAGSVACAAANSLEWFVAARFLQGMGGAMMTPVGRLVLVRSTPRADLVSAMAWVTIPGLIGPIAGPPIGGFLTEFASWHWIFLVNVPIGLAGIVLAGIFLPQTPTRDVGRVDWTGFLLSAVAASGVVFGFSVISMPALPPAVGIVTVATGVAAGIAYFAHARRTERPLLDPRIFRHRSFAASVLGGSLFRLGIGASPFLLPLMLQLGFGYSPLESGLVTFAGAGGALAMKFLAKPVLRAVGFRSALVFAALAGSALIAAPALFSQATPAIVIIGVLFIAGLVRSLFFTSINALSFAETPDDEFSQATAISAVSQQLSIACGVAFGALLLELYDMATGSALSAAGFAFAFAGIAIPTALAALPFLRLPTDIGADVSGHGARRPAAPAEG
ncbi:MAG TPA: MFS transporter [Rhizobiaceae bacterium]|nr:MFS transporter [Rhizobiaceae bacterium]